MNDGPKLYKLANGFILSKDKATMIWQGNTVFDVTDLAEIVAGDVQVEITATNTELMEEVPYYTVVGRFPQFNWTFHFGRRGEADPDNFWADWELRVEETDLCHSTLCVLAEAIARKHGVPS